MGGNTLEYLSFQHIDGFNKLTTEGKDMFISLYKKHIKNLPFDQRNIYSEVNILSIEVTEKGNFHTRFINRVVILYKSAQSEVLIEQNTNIERLTNQELIKAKDCSIQINTGTTYDSLKSATLVLPVLGDVKKVVHYRWGSKAKYITIVIGERHQMAVANGLTSGYDGAGSKASIELLKTIGFEEKRVKDLFFDGTYKNAIITVKN